MWGKVLLAAVLTVAWLGQAVPGHCKAKYVIKFAHLIQLESPQHKAALHFKKLMEERSKGDVEVQVYPAAQLGSMRESTEGVQMGNIEMALEPTSMLGNFSPAFSIGDVPFLWPNAKALWGVLDGPLGSELMKNVEKKDMKGFSFWASGWKCLTANKELRSIDDVKGLKFRVMPNPMLEAQFKAWGAHSVPMDFSELYNGLQQKVVDGQENPFQVIRMLKFWEVQKSTAVTNHGFLAYGVIGNKKWFDSLPKNIQEMIVTAEREAAVYERQLQADEEKGDRKQIEDKGMLVIDLPQKEIDRFREASKPVQDAFAPKIGKEFFDRVVAEIKKIQ
jgi:tripartite ATP-independent transporter DctP family solute receptor